MSNPPDEARELSLLSKAELRIALTDTEDKLQTVLKTYLVPVILKLASPHAAVRNKVIAICQHVNKRIKSQSIQLPVEALLKQFKDPEVGGKYTLIRNFDLMYIQQGIGRIGPKERLALLPVIISNISSTPEQHQPLIFNILLELLLHYVPPPRGGSEDTALLRHFSFDSSPGDAEFLHAWFTKLMLLTTRTVGRDPNQTCRGLTPAEYSFLTLGGKKETWNPQGATLGQKLTTAKLAVLRFLNTGAWVDEQRYLPALLASSHSKSEDSKVVELGEEIFKRSAPSVLLDAQDDSGVGDKLIKSMYKYFFLGEPEEGGVTTQTPPVRWTLRARIISLLAKSKRSVSGPQFGGKVLSVLEVSLGRESNGPTEDWNDAVGDRKRLTKEVFLYLNWFCRVTDTPIIEQYGPAIVERLRYFIAEENQRLSQTAFSATVYTRPSNGDDFRGPAFEAIGLICRRLFKTLVYEPELGVLRFMISALRVKGATATAAVRRSVEEALGSLLVGFSDSGLEYDEKVEDALAEFLVEEVEDEERENEGRREGVLTYVAARFANRGLRFSNVKGRWICLLAAGTGAQNTTSSGRSEVAEEGRRGLDPYWYMMLNPKSQLSKSQADEDKMDLDGGAGGSNVDRYSLPSFTELVNYITSSHSRIVSHHGGRTIIHNIPSNIYPATIDFFRRVLIMEALRSGPSSKRYKGFITDAQSFSTKLDNTIATDADARSLLAGLLSSYYKFSESLTAQALEKFFTLAYDGMLLNIASCAEVWVEMCELAPQDLVAHWARNNQNVTLLIKKITEGTYSVTGSGNDDLEKRNILIKALGSVVAHPECDLQLLRGVVEQCHQLQSEGSYKTYIAVLAIGYLLGRLALRARLSNALDEHTIKMSIEIVLNSVSTPTTQEKMLIEAGLQALNDLCAFGVLQKKDLSSDVLNNLLEKIIVLASKVNLEKAILSLGCFSLVFSSENAEDQEFLNRIEEALYALHENKQVEFPFAVGEALSIFAAGWGARSLVRRYLDIQGAAPPAQVIDMRKEGMLLNKVLSKVLDEFSRNTKPSLRKGACMWLLSLVESCGDLEVVASRLKDAQAAFRGFLVDRDEFVQESAAKGLTLVYEKGDKAMKDELVRSLIASFTGDTKAQTLAGQVTGDTQLFEPGSLQTGTSDHGSISTYKDIMSLASEVGDPSLIYRFMALAKHNSLWASRASFGRFGLGNILSSSSSSVDGYLTENPKLYPKLYRYRFDPNSNVRKSMNDIWFALVKDSQSILDKYFDDILEDLLKSILDREWRVREASCAALGDLLQGREVARYVEYLDRIWGAAFKVMDDIKESVRIAALTLCRVLANSMVKVVNVDSGASHKDANMVLGNLMPFLMGVQGLEAQAKEVQLFALDTLLKLIKSAGKLLRKYIPDLVEKLLGLLSTLEPQALNYLHLNAAKYNLTEEKIDAARLSGVRSSPIMDAIERCLDLLDEPTMTNLIPRLTYTIRKAVGMPSKVGSSRVLVTLTLRHSFLTKPHADELLKTVMSVILDRNDAVSTSWAVSAGYLCRLCGHDRILQLVDLAKKFWFDYEEEKARALAGEIVHDISKHATDKFNSLSASILPFIYLAKHDNSSVTITTTFSDVWSENTGGTGAIKLHLQEIVNLATESLASQRWVVKQTAAITIADICTSIGKELTKDQLELMYPAMVTAVGGKSWEGKEKVLEGFVELGGSIQASGDAEKRTETKKIMLREAKRKNKAYQAQAFKSLGRYAELAEDADLFDDIEGIIQSALEDEDGEERDEISDQAGKSTKSTPEHILYLNSLTALSQAYRQKFDQNEGNLKKVLDHIMTPPASMPMNYEVKLAQAHSLKILTSRLSYPPSTPIFMKMWDFILSMASDRGSEDLRALPVETRGKVIDDLKSLANDERSPPLRATLEEGVRQVLQGP
ncbi:proteasome stabiliser-domain-containing protein [Kalaharituber pfeilii]|nr:proteasome stabiliser-domain-containing protein [Kalaharituber pfeilii]